VTGLVNPAVGTIAGRHLADLAAALQGFNAAAELAADWGRRLARILPAGGRLLVVGNGGSAAQAQHLSSEVVGRYRDDRPPFSAVAVHTEPSALTAIANDYGIEEMFARQVQAHGRPGDVCVLLSTSGRSPNVVAAAQRARRCGLHTWAMTGPTPNPVAAVCDETLAVAARTTAAIQELHLVALHVICESMDDALDPLPPSPRSATR
jgi:D-sedoheptulose 7-phosphate isomerase